MRYAGGLAVLGPLKRILRFSDRLFGLCDETQGVGDVMDSAALIERHRFEEFPRLGELFIHRAIEVYPLVGVQPSHHRNLLEARFDFFEPNISSGASFCGLAFP